jgi:microcystin degradation protein MlrC
VTRIAIGDFKQETNSFSPVPGDWPHFQQSGYLFRGAEVLDQLRGTAAEIGGALRVTDPRPDIEIVPLLAAGTGASAGPMRRPLFDALLSDLLSRLRAAGPLDGIYLSTHGAMVAEHLDDATGEVLQAIRDAVGPDLPMTASCDLHANVTRRMADAVNAIVGYQTFPHVDLDRAGQRAMEILLAILAGSARPTPALCRLPMVLPGENGATTEGPFAEVMREIIALESRPGILSASAFSVQPWLDLPDVGCSVVVVADGDAALARSQAERLSDLFWDRRDRFPVPRTPLREALLQALRSDRGPFILSDGPDAPSSGSTGDSTEILKALLETKFDRTALVNVVDPDAVEAAIRAGVGQTLTVSVGGRLAPDFYAPVEFTGTVRTISDGRFTHKGAAYRGVEFQRGRTIVLQSGPLFLMVMEQPALQWDPELYRSVGLEPADAQLVAVKSPTGFRAAYAPFAAEILIPDVRGIASPDLLSFPWRRIGRPIHPLDALKDWRTPPIGGLFAGRQG